MNCTRTDPVLFPLLPWATYSHNVREYHWLKVWKNLSNSDLKPLNWGWQVKDQVLDLAFFRNFSVLYVLLLLFFVLSFWAKTTGISMRIVQILYLLEILKVLGFDLLINFWTFFLLSIQLYWEMPNLFLLPYLCTENKPKVLFYLYFAYLYVVSEFKI